MGARSPLRPGDGPGGCTYQRRWGVRSKSREELVSRQTCLPRQVV
jgi:hypothetical protein